MNDLDLSNGGGQGHLEIALGNCLNVFTFDIFQFAADSHGRSAINLEIVICPMYLIAMTFGL